MDIAVITCIKLLLKLTFRAQSVQYRSKISEPLNAFPTQSQRVGVLNLTRLRLRVHANANAFSEAH